MKTWFQYIDTCEKGATMRIIRTQYDQGTLSGIPANLFLPAKPVEEFYDTIFGTVQDKQQARTKPDCSLLNEIKPQVLEVMNKGCEAFLKFAFEKTLTQPPL